MKKWKRLTANEKRFAWAVLFLFLVAVGAIFGWLNSYPPRATDWAVVSGLATAVGTFVLAYFAWKAWTAALATVQGQKTSEELAAMSAYMRSLKGLAHVQKGTPAEFAPPIVGERFTDLMRLNAAHETYVRSLCDEADSAGSIWRAHHRTSEELGVVFRDSEQLLIESLEWWSQGEKVSDPDRNRQYERSSDFAKELSLLVLHWQTDLDARSDIRAICEAECAKFIRDSPCWPDKH